MNVTILIDGREAIPIRALPYITGWTMSPDLVASSLARTDLVTRLEGVVAYHLSADGTFSPILPKEWDGIEADLKILSDTLRAKEEIDHESYPAWRRKSIPLLPPACFVWKYVFEKAFCRAYAPERYTMLDERPGDRELDYSPRIPEELVVAVMQGFNEAKSANDSGNSAEKPLSTTERNTLLTIIAALCEYSAIKYQERGAASQIAKMTEELGAVVTDDTIRKALAKIPDALETRKK